MPAQGPGRVDCPTTALGNGCATPLGKACPQISTELSTRCGQKSRLRRLSRLSRVMHTRGKLSTIYGCLSTATSARKIRVIACNFPARSLPRRIFPTPASYPHLVWMKVENCGQARNTFHAKLCRTMEVLTSILADRRGACARKWIPGAAPRLVRLTPRCACGISRGKASSLRPLRMKDSMFDVKRGARCVRLVEWAVERSS
jgi:hypothetical protein